MIAVSVDNVLFILLIAGAALFQLLSKAVTKAGKNQSGKTSTFPTPQGPPQVRRVPAESDADRIRKFLEALGQPPTSSPPAPVARRSDIPPRPLAPVQPPTVMRRAWGLSREQQTKSDAARRENPPSEQPSGVARIFPPAARFEVHKASLPVELEQPPGIKASIEDIAENTRRVARETDFKSDIATLLRSKSNLRQAIILREILSPPRSLQPFDVVGRA
jgi:hypothetical protein